jgi:hypothetical protein
MRARILARGLWVVTISLVAGSLVLGLANRSEVPLYEVTSAIIAPTFATLGALISSRRPGNVIGWIFLAASVLVGVAMFSGQHATVALAPDGPTLSGGAVAALFAAQAQSAYLVFILFLVLLFPDGSCSRAAGNRWSGPSGRSLGALWSSAR